MSRDEFDFESEVIKCMEKLERCLKSIDTSLVFLMFGLLGITLFALIIAL